jgi:GxxExxY protein
MTCIRPDEIGSSLPKPAVAFTASSAATPTKISDLASLRQHLPIICGHIYKVLGDQQNERTYQNCLKVDLAKAGVNVASEVVIDLVYKGVVVGTRRADLVLTLWSGEKAVIEMKAVSDLSHRHSEQLRYYMQALKIPHGYLINMPHSEGFPDASPTTGPVTRFVLQAIFGIDYVNGLAPRVKSKSSPRTVQIVQAEIKVIDGEEMRTYLLQQAAAARQVPEVAITKAGEPCKICLKNGGRQYCFVHKQIKVVTGEDKCTFLDERQASASTQTPAIAPTKACIKNGGRENCKWHTPIQVQVADEKRLGKVAPEIATTKAGLPCKVCIKNGGRQSCQWHRRIRM